jgi:outer membrane protein assembly factor BamB
VKTDPTLPRRGGRQSLGGRLDPRSTPTIDGDRVYALGVTGDLVCLEAATGRLLWKRHLVDDLDGSLHYHGYTESPLVDGERVIVSPGGRDSTLAALDKSTGRDVWRCRVPGDRAHYASAIIGEVGGRRMVIQFLERGLAGVDARDGRLLWRVERPAGATYSIATPLFHDGLVFASETHGGGVLVRLAVEDDGVSAVPMYSTQRMRNQHGGMVLVDGSLYGCNNDILTCLDFRTGEVAWTARSVGKGSLIYADGHLYVRGERGGMALVEATPAAYAEKGRFRPPRSGAGHAWSHPVIAGGRLYLRDQELLLCYDLRSTR